MISHLALQLALRAHLRTLSVVTTGSTTLAATSTGYTRSSGSFITDGFRRGMEVVGAGFTKAANNTAKTVTGVTATTLLCSGTSTEAAGSGKTLSVGLPSSVTWENLKHEPEPGSPYVEEQYIPGPSSKITLGALGEVEIEPQYNVQVHVPENTGMEGAAKYADALITLFAPTTTISVGSDTLRVRSDTGPFRGQLQRSQPGWVVVPVTFPLRLRTQNSI